MSLVNDLLQEVLFALEVGMYMFAKVLRSTEQVLELAMPMTMAVLQSTPSPLEICACIAVVDGSEAKNIQPIANAVTILILALCDWHVPRVLPYHNLICPCLICP